MRYSSEQKADTRRRILEVASRRIRVEGPDHVSVSEIMSEAGLTHGGFYAHFESKDALVAEAVTAMFQDPGLRKSHLDQAFSGTDHELRNAFLAYCRSYLSPDHRDRPERGCPLPSLTADVGRKGGAAADALVRGFNTMSERMERVLQRLGESDAKMKAAAVTAQMVGAIALARTMGQGRDSDALLDQCYDDLARRYGG